MAGDGLPRLPQPDPRDPPPSESARNSATCMAMTMLLALLLGLAFLIGAVFPAAFYLFLVVAAFGLFFAAHYFVWGRLASQFLQDKPSINDATTSSEDSDAPRWNLDP